MLPPSMFSEFNDRVIASWLEGAGWKTRARRGEATVVMPRLQASAFNAARDVFKGDILSADCFQYIYHSLHESADSSGLIGEISKQLSRAWEDVLRDVCVPSPTRSNFSLTCFTQGSFLGPHTDAGGSEIYKVTLLLYFEDPQAAASEGDLRFRFRENDIAVSARPNRAVLFVPSNDTVHWVPEIVNPATRRFAFSGWLL